MAGHKVAICTDTHFGVRKGSQVFHDYFEKFYTETFFPKIDEEGIDTIIHMGDCFDVRKGIDYWSLDWSKRVFFTPIKERGIRLIMIVGNHDIFYKQSLKLNSPRLNLVEYDNIEIIDNPQLVEVKGENIFMVPWICEDNAGEFVEKLELAKLAKSKGCMGHLELAGFQMNKDFVCTHGTDVKHFSHFDYVFSGHFHKQSASGHIRYLGNTYQIYWNDEGETRGFNLFDVKTQKLEFVENPTQMFHKIYYDETKKIKINPTDYQNSYVKIIVEGKSTPKKFGALVDGLYDVGIHDLKVIENIDVSIDEDVEVESEDTLTTLTNYVNSMEEDSINKENLVNIFKSLYVEAQEV
jgi:DNA repair exonuclease SbcCD nuclease subunit